MAVYLSLTSLIHFRWKEAEHADHERSPQVMLEATPAWLEESYSRLAYTRHAGGHATPAVSFIKNASKPVMDTAKLYSSSEAQTLTMAEFVNYVNPNPNPNPNPSPNPNPNPNFVSSLWVAATDRGARRRESRDAGPGGGLQQVARLLPRSSADYECLRELHSGLLMHLMHESMDGKVGTCAQAPPPP